MRIKAETTSKRVVYIVQFVTYGSGLFAVTIDDEGNIREYPTDILTVTDMSFVR